MPSGSYICNPRVTKSDVFNAIVADMQQSIQISACYGTCHTAELLSPPLCGRFLPLAETTAELGLHRL